MLGFEKRLAGGKGIGIFATEDFDEGERLFEFDGPIVGWDSLDDGEHEIERFVQIGESAFMGPSGGLDDFVNHSCDPNCALVLDPAHLMALRPISAGEEITFDYSTTSTETVSDWNMVCKCGSEKCRHIISGFHTVPKEVRDKYVEMGIVPEYVVNAISPKRV